VDLYNALFVVHDTSHSRRSDMDHTVLPANITPMSAFIS